MGTTRETQRRGRYARIAMVLALGVAWLGSVASPAQAQLGGRDGRLAWFDGSLVSATADGTDQKILLPGAGVDPSWSQDGQEIAYAGDGQIWIVHADGSEPVQVTNNPAGSIASQPAFSPDGRIAYTLQRGSSQSIVLTDANGSHAHVVSGTVAYPMSASWSSDGRLFFLGFVDKTEYLYLTDAAGKALRQLGPAGEVSSMDVSPDGRWLAFDRHHGEDEVRLASLRAVVSGTGWGDLIGVGQAPAISPAGDLVGFREPTGFDYQTGQWLGSEIGVYSTDPNGRAAFPGLVLTTDSNADSLAWQPLCTIKVTASNETVLGTAAGDVICVDGHNDVVRGGAGNDVILTWGINDRLYGGRGRDVLVSKLGGDQLFGGRGVDLLNSRNASEHLDRTDGGRGKDICLTDPHDAVASC